MLPCSTVVRIDGKKWHQYSWLGRLCPAPQLVSLPPVHLIIHVNGQLLKHLVAQSSHLPPGCLGRLCVGVTGLGDEEMFVDMVRSLATQEEAQSVRQLKLCSLDPCCQSMETYV